MSERIPRARAPRNRPFPSEADAWQKFERMATDYANAMTALDGQATGGLPPILESELDKLCNQGNSLALRFRKALEESKVHLREAHEPGKEPPPATRLRHVKF